MIIISFYSKWLRVTLVRKYVSIHLKNIITDKQFKRFLDEFLPKYKEIDSGKITRLR